MKKYFITILLLTLNITICYAEWLPRTLENKIISSDLIVVGKLTDVQKNDKKTVQRDSKTNEIIILSVYRKN